MRGQERERSATDRRASRLGTTQLARWALFLIPAIVIASFETIRHTLLVHVLPMTLGNWLTACIDALVIAFISRRLFEHFSRTERELLQERASRAVLEERERLARVLHDQIAQSIFFAGVQIQSARTRAEQLQEADLLAKLEAVQVSLREMEENVRQAIFNLRHTSADSIWLEDRIRTYLAAALGDSGIEWAVHFPSPEPKLHPSVQVQLFGICQEAVTNVVKHARASHVTVSLVMHGEDAWTFRIADDGIGFQETGPRDKRYGLDIIASRASDIGADMAIESGPHGTAVVIRRGPHAVSR